MAHHVIASFDEEREALKTFDGRVNIWLKKAQTIEKFDGASHPMNDLVYSLEDVRSALAIAIKHMEEWQAMRDLRDQMIDKSVSDRREARPKSDLELEEEQVILQALLEWRKKRRTPQADATPANATPPAPAPPPAPKAPRKADYQQASETIIPREDPDEDSIEVLTFTGDHTLDGKPLVMMTSHGDCLACTVGEARQLAQALTQFVTSEQEKTTPPAREQEQPQEPAQTPPTPPATTTYAAPSLDHPVGYVLAADDTLAVRVTMTPRTETPDHKPLFWLRQDNNGQCMEIVLSLAEVQKLRDMLGTLVYIDHAQTPSDSPNAV